MPPVIRNKFSNLGRKTKLIILFFSDILMGFVAWTAFGPPLINAVGTDFEISIWDTISGQFFQFIFPISIAIIFMYLLGFYRSLIRFFDSMDSLVTSITGSLIFGFSIAIHPSRYFSNSFINHSFSRKKSPFSFNKPLY